MNEHVERRQERREIRASEYLVEVHWRDGQCSRFTCGRMTPHEVANCLEQVAAEIRTYARTPEQSER